MVPHEPSRGIILLYPFLTFFPPWQIRARQICTIFEVGILFLDKSLLKTQ